ncbi:MAG: hypothetical protein OXF65_13975 [Acidimicrobiaceae bacterium]|nr:hypothetical protein [Acidimicrobiaceae bacterium]
MLAAQIERLWNAIPEDERETLMDTAANVGLGAACVGLITAEETTSVTPGAQGASVQLSVAATTVCAALLGKIIFGDDDSNQNNQSQPNNQNQNDGNGQGDGQQPNDPQPTLTPEADPIPENPTRQYYSEFQRWSEAIRKHQRGEISDADRRDATERYKQVRCNRGRPGDQHYCR